ncbi:tryptophan--tRNA ligase [Candidatus Kapabacteria bacterium]|nr:tryptophan--tRNA ligase [Candidatus Kapabacteria bacterium]
MENQNKNKKRILSGVTPSGYLTIGHITGALANWVKLQDEFDSYFMVADLHAITVRQVPADLRQRTLDTLAFFLAAGIDPDKSTVFVQSQVPAHSELTWVLSTFTGMGECQRMTQFKDKSAKNMDNINVGLFSYPILMACDILLYQADCVPVGQDQKQHLELTRNIAQRFNHHYSDTFTSPEPFIPKIGGRIMSLQDPKQKMSKSDANENATIFLKDEDDVIKRKIKRAVTDSGTGIIYNENNPGIANLMELYSIATNTNYEQIESKFESAGYAEFKEACGNAVAEFVAPIREKFKDIRQNKSLLNEIIQHGKEKAGKTAFKTLRKVYKKVGFYQG